MRGTPDPQLAMLTSLSTEELIPVDHPIRKIRVVVDAVLSELNPVFDEMYAARGRRSVPPEQLLKASVLMAMYSIRSGRAFCERLNYDLLFKWFLGSAAGVGDISCAGSARAEGWMPCPRSTHRSSRPITSWATTAVAGLRTPRGTPPRRRCPTNDQHGTHGPAGSPRPRRTGPPRTATPPS